MSSEKIALLGAVAGLTIFLGLPVGRLRAPAPKLRAGLNAGAIGVLLFLLWDVLSGAFDPIETALHAAQHGGGTWTRFSGLSAVFAVGLTLGLMGLVYYERWMRGRTRGRPIGPGAMAISAPTGVLARLDDGARLALFIAVGIGLHNFSEGLAIGQSAARGEISFAVLLIIGFGLHNATEGFGIVAPLSTEAERPSWQFLAVMGLIGGGPTFVGTIVGQSIVNDALYIAFLALAAGSILYVVIQLLQVAARSGEVEVVMWCILLGLLAGFATDMIVTAAGV